MDNMFRMVVSLCALCKAAHEVAEADSGLSVAEGTGKDDLPLHGETDDIE